MDEDLRELCDRLWFVSGISETVVDGAGPGTTCLFFFVVCVCLEGPAPTKKKHKHPQKPCGWSPGWRCLCQCILILSPTILQSGVFFRTRGLWVQDSAAQYKSTCLCPPFSQV